MPRLALEGVAKAVVQLRWWLLSSFVVLIVGLGPRAAELEHDDDVLAFLPADRPEVIDFHRAAQRYEMLDLMLVGLADDGASLFAPERVRSIRAMARDLATIDGVGRVLSFPDLPHPKVDALGLEIEALVPEGLQDEASIAARVAQSSAARGSLIADDGRAAALVVVLARAEASDQRSQTIATILARAQASWPGQIHPGGAPYVQWQAAQSSRADLAALSPIVIAVLGLVTAVLLRSLWAAAINLSLTAAAVLGMLGAMAYFGVASTLVSDSIPVMMVALGGAFGVHVLAAFQRATGNARERAETALAQMLRPVTLSAWTTAFGFLALWIMPQAPMRQHGVLAALGVLSLWLVALLVLPAILSILPDAAMRRGASDSALPPTPWMMPAWVMAILAVGALGIGLQSRTSFDAREMFAEDSPLHRHDAFFSEAFGGSQFLQLSVDGDLREPAVARVIQNLALQIEALPGVVEVRSPVPMAAMLNSGLGGRRGIPENVARARRVWGQLANEPAMAMLMRPDLSGALLQIRLAPMTADAAGQLVTQVRQIMAEAAPSTGLFVMSTDIPGVSRIRRREVERRLSLISGRSIELPATSVETEVDASLRAKLEALRDEALSPDEGAVEVEPPETERLALEPTSLVGLGPAQLEAKMRTLMPTLLREDPEGLHFAAEHLAAWVQQAVDGHRTAQRCRSVVGEGDCAEFAGILAELDDAEWGIDRRRDPLPELTDGAKARQVDLRLGLLGQPLLGRAMAESMQTAAWQTTLLSALAIALVTLLGGCLHAMVPALWALVIAVAGMHVTGHVVGVATGMVYCIVLGLGVDFAIHLEYRRRYLVRHDDLDDRAAAEMAHRGLAPVIRHSALQLAAAFSVLGASSLRPLSEFGTGLAMGVLVAAFAAIWWMPVLWSVLHRNQI